MSSKTKSSMATESVGKSDEFPESGKHFSSNFLGNTFFSTARKMFWAGCMNTFSWDSIHDLPRKQSAEQTLIDFTNSWEKEKRQGNPSFGKAILRFVAFRWCLSIIFDMFFCGLTFVLPLMLPHFVKWIVDRNRDPGEGYWYFGASILAGIFMIVFRSLSSLVLTSEGLRVRTIVTELVYKKTIKIGSFDPNIEARVANLINTDANAFFETAKIVNLGLLAPFYVAALTVALYYQIALHAFFTFGLAIFFAVLNPFIGILYARSDERIAEETDSRNYFTTEFLEAIKTIKYYAWEKPFRRQLCYLREREQRQTHKFGIFKALWGCLMHVHTVISAILILLDIGLNDGHVAAASLFSAYALLGLYINPTANFGQLFSILPRWKASFGRVSIFLRQNELPQVVYSSLKKSTTNVVSSRTQNLLSEKVSVLMKSATFKRASKETALDRIDLEVRKGEFLIVCGEKGTGKTNLANAIAGLLELGSGTFEIAEKVAFVSQQPFLFNASFKDNILCGSDYNKRRFGDIIKKTFLDRVIKKLPNGEDTILNGKIILSENVKQQINIARALYSNREIIVFDNSLSTFNEAMSNIFIDETLVDFLHSKTRILFTDNHHILEKGDQIAIMQKNDIVFRGSYSALLSAETDITKKIAKSKSKMELEKEEQNEKEQNEVNEKDVNKAKKTKKCKKAYIEKDAVTVISNGPLVQGNVSCGTYKTYTLSVNPIFLILIFLVTCLLLGSKIMVSIWFAMWTDETDLDNESAMFYATGFICFACLEIATTFLLFYFCMLYGVQCAEKLHNDVLRRIFSAPLSLFEKTPLKKLMSLLKKDIHTIDATLPTQVQHFAASLCNVTYFIVVVSVGTWWTLFVTITLFIAAYIFTYLYRKSYIELHRFDGRTKANVITHLNKSIDGIQIIRNYNLENSQLTIFRKHIDTNAKTTYNLNYSKFWFTQICNLIGLLILIIILLVICVPRCQERKPITSAEVAMIIHVCCSLVSLVSTFCLSFVELETSMLGVARLHVLSTMEKEEVSKPVHKRSDEKENADEIKKPYEHEHPPKNWPTNGSIVFANYQMKFLPGKPLVLSSLNFSVKSGHKVGVVGTPKLNKQSLKSALCRTTEAYSGHIEIDGIDISKLFLEDLRNHISVISPDCPLVSGTVRANIDPTNAYSEEQIWKVLEKVKLSQMIKNLDDVLDAQVLSQGDEFTSSERMLLCVARALLQNNKIVIFEESEVNHNLRQLIFKLFSESTMLIISDHLHSVMSCDRVIVMNNGEVEEYDEPLALLNKSTSALHKMAGKSQESLKNLAEKRSSKAK